MPRFFVLDLRPPALSFVAVAPALAFAVAPALAFAAATRTARAAEETGIAPGGIRYVPTCLVRSSAIGGRVWVLRILNINELICCDLETIVTFFLA